MNRWKLTDELRKEYKPIVESFIDDVERNDPDGELIERDFTDTKLNPSTLGYLIEELGYERVNQDDNGWELDFWIYYHKNGYKPIQIKGCGMTFELILCEDDTDHYELEREQEENLKYFLDDNNDRIMSLIDKIDNLLIEGN